MQELKKRASMFIRVKDMRRYQDNVQSAPIQVKTKRAVKELVTCESNRPRERKQSIFTSYAHPGWGPTSSKYCRYHRNNGHTTKECETLRDKIEELICAGHLKHYIRGEEGGSRPRYDRSDSRSFERRDEKRSEWREPRRNQNVEHKAANQQQDRRPDDRPPLRGTINTISGRFTSGGCSSSSRKRHLRVIQFVHAIANKSQRRMPPSHSLTQTSQAPIQTKMIPWS